MASNITVSKIDDFIDLIYGTDPKYTCHRFTKEFYGFIKNSILPEFQTLKLPLMEKPNGYVAGGFARWIFFAAKKLAECSKWNHWTLESQCKHMLSYYMKELHGDIDIFFNTETDKFYWTAIGKNADFGKKTTANTTDFATSWKLESNVTRCCRNHDYSIICQYISCHVGNPISMMENFDFANSRIAIDFATDTVWYDENLPNLEAGDIISLHRQDFDQTDVVNRLHKYALKHNYKSFDKSNKSLMFFVKWCREKLKDDIIQQQKLLQLMNHSSLFELKDLSLFMGVITVEVPDEYPPYSSGNRYGACSTIEVDAAVKAIQDRFKGKTVDLSGDLDDKPKWQSYQRGSSWY
jgi:hypothetical protein